MRRSSLFLVAAMLIAFAFLALPAHATKTYAGAEADFPTVNGFPALFGTTASGTGTATQYLRAVPILVNATTGAILVDSSSAATSTPTIVDEYGPITASTTTVLLTTNGSQALTLISNCRQIMLNSTGTFQFSVGTTTVDPNLPGVYNVTFPCTKEIPVGIANVATTTRIGIRQWGR